MNLDPALLTAVGVLGTAAGTVVTAIFGYKNHVLGTQIHISTNSRYDEMKQELISVRADAAIAAQAAIKAAALLAHK